MRDSVVFYRSFYEAIKHLQPEEFKRSVEAIMEYGLYGVEVQSNGIERTIFLLVKPQIDANNKRYLNGTKGGRQKTNTEPSDNQDETKVEPNDNQDRTKVEPNSNQTVTKAEPKEKDKDKVKEKDKDKKTFIAPTLDEVRAYCKSKEYDKMDPEAFLDFYESKGWMIGKNRMKDWKAAVRNWNRNQRQGMTAKGKENAFNNFDQRSYDFGNLEKQLLTVKGEVHDEKAKKCDD